MKPAVLGGMSAAAFLSRYWQKSHCLFKQVLNEPATLSPDELAGLACEEEVDARLIVEKSDPPWQVHFGPLDASLFQQLPPSHWILLINGVDRLLTPISTLLDAFDFIPSWRMDDIMISYSPRGGSVGPHVDQYDVFLLQMQGEKRWKIAYEFVPERIAGIDLRILKHFNSEQCFQLSPGDMLYLPPGVAHHGVAVSDDCITYSIGFRAPDIGRLIQSFFERWGEKFTDQLYRDPDLQLQPHGEITAATIEKIHGLLSNLSFDTDDVANWFARFVTESPQPVFHSQSLSKKDFAEAFQKHAFWMQNESLRMNYFFDSEGRCKLYMDECCFDIENDHVEIVKLICDKRRVPISSLLPYLQHAGVLDLLHLWHNQGYFAFTDD